MKTLRTILFSILAAVATTWAISALKATEASARPSLCALVDDDWEPSEGKSADAKGRYSVDPGYEIYIREALDLAGIDYDLFEIWPDGASAPQRPTLATLEGYPLVLWNCAANDSAVLQPEEMQLLVDYMNLGGKVLLSGQGILDDLVRNEGDPVSSGFLHEVLGIDVPFLNLLAQDIQALPFGYFDGLGQVALNFDSLPDPAPDRSDAFYPMPFMDAYMVGEFPSHPDLLVPVSTDRFKWQPLHFQSFLPEAIVDAQLRANWLSSTMRWLGFEGDNLYDFMLGMEDFVLSFSTAPQDLSWNAVDRQVDFHSDGSSPGIARQEKVLIPLGLDWRIGETFLVGEAGTGSRTTLLGLDGYHKVEVEARSSEAWPGHFEIVFRISLNRSLIYEDSLDGLEAGKIFRMKLHYRNDIAETGILLTDSLGNPRWNSSTSLQPVFEKCYIQANGDSLVGATPMTGWIDDLFFEGSLSHEGDTAVEVGLFELSPAGGGVDLRWEVGPTQPQAEFRLSRDGREIEFTDLGGSFLARDRDPSLREGGRFRYELSSRTEAGPWSLLRSESILLDGRAAELFGRLDALPNPFNPVTEIRYELSSEAPVRLAVYDLEGRRLVTLLDGPLLKGPGSVTWNGRDETGRPLPSGLYLAKLAGPGSVKSAKLVLLK